MFKGMTKRIVIGVTAASVAASNLAAATTMPTPDYGDITAAAAIGFAVVLTVGLLMKAKKFFR